MRLQHRGLPALIVILVSLLAGTAMAAPGIATLQTASGTVTVKRQGTTTFMPLAVDGALFAGEIVRTGADGKARLLFRDGSETRLNAGAAIEILDPAATGKGKHRLFRALSGELWVRLRPGKGIEAHDTIAFVYGTDLDLKVEADGTTILTVLAGEVDFSNSRGHVLVSESQQSIARPDSPPTAPVTIQNPGLIIEWTLDLERVIIPREKFFITPDRRELEGELPRRRERALRLPDDPAARREHGDALFDSGRYADALREYQEADRRAPGQPATLTRIGDTLLELGRLDEAENSFRAALAPSAQTTLQISHHGDTETQRSAGDVAHAPALVGLAWLALTRDRAANAQQLAEQALAALTAAARIQPAAWKGGAVPASSVEARVALGLSLMRQPGKLAEAVEVFHAALNEEPAAYRYQARAWLALVYLGQDDPVAALHEARESIRLAPQSALAHGNLALVYFHNGKALEAEREARLATHLKPDSVAARVVLGQALLATGDVDGAAQTAAYAVALDPRLPQAHYLLGIADAQRRDYRHAARELEESLRLAPEFTPAAAALARVETRMGRENEAVALLTGLLTRHHQSDTVLAALGGVYYEQARYREAAAQYREAIRVKPNSALYHAELARTLLDANRLNEAIHAGETSVRLAPAVGQYHATLGLAYDFSRLSVQAEREFRQALALDPQNALAHLVLGLKAAQFDPKEQRLFAKKSGQGLEELLRQGLQAVTSSAAVGSITQAFLYDPAVSDQVLRGGIHGETTLSGGGDRPLSPSLTHRTMGVEGRLHLLGVIERERDHGTRLNDDFTVSDLSQNAAFVLDPRTSLFARFSHRRTQQGLPGPVSAPDLDDRENARNTLGELAMRRRIGLHNHLWLGLSRPTGRLDLLNPDQDSASFLVPLPDGGFSGFSTPRQELKYRNLVPELRLELALNRAPARPTFLTLGAADAHLEPTLTARLFFPGEPPVITPHRTRLDGRLFIAYAQLTQRVNDRLSFAAQLRRQRLKTTTQLDILGGGTQSARASQSHWLPSLLVNYHADRRTLLRLFFNRQAQEQELTVIAFRPMETLLSTEPLVMPQGSPGRTRTVELDVERYLSSRDFLKLFLFRTAADGLRLGDLPTIQRVERTGLGLRYERRLTRDLYGQLSYLLNRTTNRTPFAPFDGGTAPYHSPRLAGIALNYVSPSGTKVGLVLNYTGRFFQDTGDFTAPDRPVFPSHMYVDLTLAHEPSVRLEFFVKISNLFNRSAIQFHDFPTGGRRVLAGATARF